MSIRRAVVNFLNNIIRPAGVQIIGKREIEFFQQRLGQFALFEGPSSSQNALPSGAEDYLRPDNPRLAELRSRYEANDSPAIRHCLWTDTHTSTVDLGYFRGDNIYQWQYQDDNAEINYFVSTSYLKSIDTLNLFDCLREDGLFGVHCFKFDDDLVSRDLLDSISELLFFEETMRISRVQGLSVLDIGAGYGRLAHRMSTALPNLETIICTDAVAKSTFLCEYYLRFRGVENKAHVVPLDEIEKAIEQNQIYLATNIHSFSECTLVAINWWLDLLAKNRVRYLFIVPDLYANAGTRLLTAESPPQDFMPSILARGYRLAEKRTKYASRSVQRFGLSPTVYYLFEFER
jgi:Methyltransferase small domain